MYLEYPSHGKINITLRVVGRREDGYHRLVSVFRKLPALERLTVDVGLLGDRVNVSGVEIKGINLVKKVIDFLRERDDSIPPLSVSIHKSVPPGTGLGAGTGNGAAIYRFLRDFFGVETSPDDLKPLGSDLPFLASDEETALVKELGDRIEPLNLHPFSVLLVIPRWRSSTVSAYRDLDGFFTSGWPMTEEEASEEAESVLSKLRSGLNVGLLPNDFLTPLLRRYPEYGELFSACGDSGALAWGLSGSGSSAFALYPKSGMSLGFMNFFSGLDFTEKMIILE